jgi:hypothetical protein
MPIKKKKGSAHPSLKAVISPDTLKSIEANGLIIIKGSNEDEKRKYSRKSKQQKTSFVTGYDLLQYNIVIKPYIIQKYHLKDVNELDVLLYLYPFQFFVRGDFAQLPTNTTGHSFKVLIELGLVVLRVKGAVHKKINQKNIYSLSDNSKAAVKSYYQFLSGERTLVDNSYAKPFFFQENTKVNAQRRALMLKLKQKSEHSPSIFTKGVLK